MRFYIFLTNPTCIVEIGPPIFQCLIKVCCVLLFTIIVPNCGGQINCVWVNIHFLWVKVPFCPFWLINIVSFSHMSGFFCKQLKYQSTKDLNRIHSEGQNCLLKNHSWQIIVFPNQRYTRFGVCNHHRGQWSRHILHVFLQMGWYVTEDGGWIWIPLKHVYIYI